MRTILKLKEGLVDSKKDINRTIRFDEKTDGVLVQAAGKLDCSVSQLLRAAFCVGVPLLMACPSLVERIDLDDMDKNMFCS